MAKKLLSAAGIAAAELDAAIVKSLAELKAAERLESRRKAYASEWQATHPEPISEPMAPIGKAGIMAIAERQAERVGSCPSHYVHGTDANGHNFAKELYCGAEWCVVCGKKDSVSHKRRFASILPKAQQVRSLGYFVVEWPLKSRDKLRSRKVLSEYGKIITAVFSGKYELSKRRKEHMITNAEAAELKAKYYSRGIRRYHYFGDINKELSKLGLKWQTAPPADDTAPTVKTNIHANVLVEAEFIPASWLRHIQYNLREALNEPELIVHYGYTREPGKMVHVLKYVTRATFLDIEWDKWLAGQLYGFRNMRSWGTWHEPPVWSLEDLPAEAAAEIDYNAVAVQSLAESRCYMDGLPITWSKPRRMVLLRDEIIQQELGAGYYRLADTPPPRSMDKAFRMVRRVMDKHAERDRLAALSMRDYVLDSRRYSRGNQLALGSYEDATLWGGGYAN